MVLANIFAMNGMHRDITDTDIESYNSSMFSSKAQSYTNLADLMDDATTQHSPYDQLTQAGTTASSDRVLVWNDCFFPLITQAFRVGTYDSSIEFLCVGAFHLIEKQAGVIEVTEQNQCRVSRMADELAAAAILQNNRINNCADVLARWVTDWVMNQRTT